jgi:hypothetical protein
MLEQKKASRTICAAIAAALLLASAFVTLDSLTLHDEALAVEQSELIGSTSGNDAPITDIFTVVVLR